MAKLTKTQYKRLYTQIWMKSQKAWSGEFTQYNMSSADLMKIETICRKYLNKF